MIDIQLLCDRLSARFGIGLTVESQAGSPSDIMLRVDGLEAPNGFCIGIKPGWRSVEARFVPDTFAAGLMKIMRQQIRQTGDQFQMLIQTFTSVGIRCVVDIDRKTVDTAERIPEAWNRFDLTCIRLTDKTDEQYAAEGAVSACLALLLVLLPVEECTSPVQFEGMPEGALSQIWVNKYERNPANRAAAITAHGLMCKGCGFDFAKFYGPLGEGFIEVHHRTRVADMGANYVVNPQFDLVPLCSNCHHMVHRDTPPISPENLREILLSRGVISA